MKTKVILCAIGCLYNTFACFKIEINLSETIKERSNPNAKLKTVSMETKEILAELDRAYKQAESKQETSKPKADKFNAVCTSYSYFSF